MTSLATLLKMLELKPIIDQLSQLEQTDSEALSAQFLHGSIAVDAIDEVFQELAMDSKITTALHQSLNSLISLDLHLAIALRILDKVQNAKRYYKFKANQISLLLDKVPWVARELSKANQQANCQQMAAVVNAALRFLEKWLKSEKKDGKSLTRSGHDFAIVLTSLLERASCEWQEDDVVLKHMQVCQGLLEHASDLRLVASLLLL